MKISPVQAYLISGIPFSLTCRQRHVKCDETTPICARCRLGTRACVYDVGTALPHHQKVRPVLDVVRRDVIVSRPPRQQKSSSTGDLDRSSTFSISVSQPPLRRSFSHFRDSDSRPSDHPRPEALNGSIVSPNGSYSGPSDHPRPEALNGSIVSPNGSYSGPSDHPQSEALNGSIVSPDGDEMVSSFIKISTSF
jgi:hypothetical protein